MKQIKRIKNAKSILSQASYKRKPGKQNTGPEQTTDDEGHVQENTSNHENDEEETTSQQGNVEDESTEIQEVKKKKN
jgi:hypothetical protein